MDCAERTHRCQYVEALEEERRKIQVFQRELPLCLELVIRAIEACKKELSGTAGCSDCSEQTSSDAPVLEEFIPIKPIGCGEAEDDEDEDRSSNKRSKKSDWLRSVRLWNQSPDPSPPTHNKEEVPRKAVVKRNGTGGAFQPFQRDKPKTWSSDGKKNGNGGEDASSDKAAVPATSSSAETVGNGGGTTTRKEDKDAGGERKQRRCWSPELHRRFLIALQQLGGSHAATPKQIRELMKVDGLTNDEVKSHLQKYRLHTRRPSPTIHNRLNPQAPQFVVVGGIWVPPLEFGATTGDAATIPALQPPHSATVVARKAERQRVQVSGSDNQGGHVLCNESPVY